MADDDKKYNGWTNYETWNLALWMDNEQGSYNFWREQAQEAWEAADAPSANALLTGREPFTREEKAKIAISHTLKDHFEEQMADMLDASGQSGSMWADLLGAALSEVNWPEVAGNMIEGVNKGND